MIDTHCHLSDSAFSVDLDTVISSAFESGLDKIICSGAEIGDIFKISKIIQKYDNVYCTIGIHPEYAIQYTDDDLIKIKDFATNKKMVGIGEIGLDYYHGDENRFKQIELFEKQIEIAKSVKLPIAIHTRNAEQDTINIVKDISGVLHCFTGSFNMAKVFLDKGFYFSASGIITFKNAIELRETFKKIPIDRIVIETDSPYCAPVPLRGKRCEPKMILETLKVLANIKNVSFEKINNILNENTLNLYQKLK